MLHAVLFYVLSTVLVASSVMVVASRNPVHAVLFLILCFFNAAGLFLLMGAEFLALILVIVYVGAVAVLFLFVVMMLDIDLREIRRGFRHYLPVAAMVGIILLVQLTIMATAWHLDSQALSASPLPTAGGVDNTRALGRVLYTDYFYPFQVSGLILLVAMIGAIVLTLRHKKDVRRQKVTDQMARTPADAVEIRKVQTGQGAL